MVGNNSPSHTSSANGPGGRGVLVNASGSLPERPRVADHVYARLRDALLSGQLPPGGRLSVPSIAEQFRVSRSPVREAVQRLVQEGLATEEPHRGAVVTQVRPDELIPLYEVREVLEGLAVRLAAERATGEERAAMQANLQQHVEAVERGDLQQHIVFDLRFHALTREAARNSELSASLDRVQSRIMIAMLSGDSATWPKQAIVEHRRILDAILAGNPDEAEAAARAHVARVRNGIAALESDSPTAAG